MDPKTEYVEKLSAQMAEWDVQIEQLKEAAESVTAEEKAKNSKIIAALQLKLDQAAENFRRLARTNGKT